MYGTVKRFGWVAVLALSLGAGCGDEGWSTIGKEDLKVNGQNYCHEVAELLCHNMFLCCTGKQLEAMLGETITVRERDCVPDVELICENKMYNYLYGIDKGSIKVTTTTATECLQSMIQLGECFPVQSELPWEDACMGEEDSLRSSIFKGQQGAGSSCVYQEECQKDHYCGVDRQCKALPVDGEACRNGSQCAENFYCQAPTKAGETATCKSRKSAGDACEGSGQCVRKHFCGDIDSKTGKGTCTALLAAGERCAGSHECDSAKCTPGVCSKSGAACYKSEECKGECKMTPGGTPSGKKECTKDDECDMKFCANSGNNCVDDNQCDVSSSEKCKADTCNTQTCSGSPTCADNYGVVDYCVGPGTALGLF